MHRNNSAGRLLDLFESAQRAAGNKVAIEVWTHLFNLGTRSTPVHDYEVARLLHLAGGQVKDLRIAAKRAGMEDQYFHRIDTAEQFLSVRYLGSNWDQSVKPHLNDANAAVLQMCAGFLSEEEERISPEMLAESKKTVTKLQADIEDAELPFVIKEFLRYQITLMEQAIREYPIRGAAAFREASDISAEGWVENETLVAPYATSPEVRSVANFWEKLDKLVTRGILYGHLAKMLWGGATPFLKIAAENGKLPSTAVQFIQPLLGSGAEATPKVRSLPSGSATQPQ